MAKEMLDTIRRAESEIVNRQTMAQNSAQIAAKRARQEADEAVKAAIAKAESEVAQSIERTYQQCAERSAQSKESAKAECDKLEAIADSNRECVISMVIDAIAQK